MTSDSLCLDCVRDKVCYIQTKEKVHDDAKKLSTLLKDALLTSERSFWVGKESLRNWKQLVLDKFKNESDDEDDEEKQSIDRNTFQINNSEARFNEEIVCMHGRQFNVSDDESVYSFLAFLCL